MAERFQKLFALENLLYTEGSPIVIEAGALLLDTQTNGVLAQLKLKNIAKENVVAVKVGIKTFDVANREQETIFYSYLDFSATYQESFGMKNPIAIQNSIVRSFVPFIAEVVFEGGKMWTCNTSKWQQFNCNIDKLIALAKDREKARLAKQEAERLEAESKAEETNMVPIISIGAILCAIIIIGFIIFIS